MIAGKFALFLLGLMLKEQRVTHGEFRAGEVISNVAMGDITNTGDRESVGRLVLLFLYTTHYKIPNRTFELFLSSGHVH